MLIYGVSFQIYAFVLSFTSIGIPNAISNLIAKKEAIGDHKNSYKIFKVAIVLFSIIGFLGSILLYMFANKIAKNYLKVKEASLSIIALSPSIFIVSIIAVLKGYLNGREKIKDVAYAQTIDQLSKTIFTIVIIEILAQIMKKENTEIFAAIASFGTTIGNIFELIVLLKKHFNYFPEIKKEVISSVNTKRIGLKNIIVEITKYALPISISALIATFSKNVDSFTVINVLTKVIGNKQAKIEYGILDGKIETLINFPLAFNTAISTALLPTVSANYNKLSKAKGRIIKTCFLEILISFLVMITYIIFANNILKILFPNASKGASLLRISSFSIVLITIEQILTNILHGIGKTTIIIKTALIEMVLKTILNLILVPKVNFILGGTKGVAFSTIVSHILVDILLSIALIKETKIHIKTKNIKYNVKRYIVNEI